jgi:hypothetical protein
LSYLLQPECRMRHRRADLFQVTPRERVNQPTARMWYQQAADALIDAPVSEQSEQ